jgi:hypothetical protein
MSKNNKHPRKKGTFSMKRLLTTTIFLTYFFSISAMNLALRQSARSLRVSHKKGLSFYSTPVNKKPILQIMKEKKHSIINDTASLSNIVAAALTNYSLFLLPIASQQLHEIVNDSHKQIVLQRNESQVMRDFDLFIKTNSCVVDDIKRIAILSKRIEMLQESYAPTNQQLINEDSTFYMQQYKKDISELEKQKKCYEEGIIYVMNPFFEKYALLSILDFLDDNKKQLKQLQNLLYYTRGLRLSSLPLAMLPLMFRDVEKSENSIDMLAASLAISLCAVPYGALMVWPVEGMPLCIQLSYWISIMLSMKAALNNTDASVVLGNKICDQGTNLEHTIKILEIQLAHLRKPETILKRSL